MHPIQALLHRHKGGAAAGVTSVCSAHPLVLEAALRHAVRHGANFALVEATCNQVNQEGGYTGMTPARFRGFVAGLAAEAGLDGRRLVLGGDHLGPNPWTSLPAEAAMAKAETMVAAYVRAGFSKLHLDCSMPCADDPAVLPPPLIAARAARLCRVAEEASEETSRTGDGAPVYVIGTEVPVPGGAAEELGALAVTLPETALETVALHRTVFRSAGLERAWERVVALVVQPGVEFDHDKIVPYDPPKAAALSRAIDGESLVYEAHSTDYQSAAALAALVRDHFAILKVGPGLTFALREALWALDAVEQECVAPEGRARLRETVLGCMRENPVHWRRYYHGSGRALDLQLQYSLSDRIRYYWPDPRIAEAQTRLFENLRRAAPPAALLRQYLPQAQAALSAGAAPADPRDLVLSHVDAVLDAYYGACTQNA